MASPTVAANAYAALSRIMESGGTEKGGQAAGGPSFSALLKDAVGSVLDAGKKSDAQNMAMITGKANGEKGMTGDAKTVVEGDTQGSVRESTLSRYSACILTERECG